MTNEGEFLIYLVFLVVGIYHIILYLAAFIRIIVSAAAV